MAGALHDLSTSEITTTDENRFIIAVMTSLFFFVTIEKMNNLVVYSFILDVLK